MGWWFLNLEKLTPFFSWLLDIPFVGFTNFNNTIVMGSLLFSLAAYIPLYFIVRLFLKYWRAFLAPAVRKSKLVVYLSKLPLIVKIGEMA